MNMTVESYSTAYSKAQDHLEHCLTIPLSKYTGTGGSIKVNLLESSAYSPATLVGGTRDVSVMNLAVIFTISLPTVHSSLIAETWLEATPDVVTRIKDLPYAADMALHENISRLGLELLFRPIYSGSQSTQHSDTCAPGKLIARIRDVFMIGMSDLGAILNVSRLTVYAWLEGQEPMPDAITMKRIQELARVADVAHQANIPRLDMLVHRRILEGRSLFDLLKASDDPLDAIEKLKVIGDSEAQARCEQKGFGINLRPLEDVLDEF